MPVPIVRDLEEYELSSSVRVHGLEEEREVVSRERTKGRHASRTHRKGEGRHESADETTPHRLVSEVVAHLLFKIKDESQLRT